MEVVHYWGFLIARLDDPGIERVQKKMLERRSLPLLILRAKNFFGFSSFNPLLPLPLEHLRELIAKSVDIDIIFIFIIYADIAAIAAIQQLLIFFLVDI